MSFGRRAGLLLTLLGLAAACAGPNPTPTLYLETATPNAVQTAQALLTASFASLTPTASEAATATLDQTLRVSETLRVSTGTPTPPSTATPAVSATSSETPNAITATPNQILRVSETPRVSTGTATPRFTATPTLSATADVSATAGLWATVTVTPTAPLRIEPGNAVSVTLAAVLTPATFSGTRVLKLDQAAWAPGGQLAAAGAGGVLFASGDVLTTTPGYTMGVWTPTLSFSPDGLALAVGSVAGAVRLFRRADGALLLQLAQPDLRVSQVRYRPGPPGVLAQMLASLGGDNTIYVWDTAYHKFLGALTPGPSSAAALEFSGDGRWLAAASGEAVMVWDVGALPAAGWSEPISPTLTLPQGGNITGLALSADGFWLAAADETGAITLWTLPAGQLFETFAWPGAAAQRLTFSPDGQMVAAAYADRVIRLWGLQAPAMPLAQLSGHTGPITSVTFSPDGSALASSSWDGSIRIWKIGSGR